jgi:pimeloyl-ACP methyl ester carboxylesterase
LFSEDVVVSAERLEGFSTPTLLIAGDQDLLFPAEALQAVAEMIPGAAYREFNGCGHSVYFEDAEAFNPVIAEFVDPHFRHFAS